MSTNSRTIRWGILATGRIADNFATDLLLVEGSELAAVGSRRPDAANEFAERFGAARAHGSYEELAADPDVDVIYIATPHSRHLDDVMICLEGGKHVLCEKPLAMNAADAETMITEARSRGLFFAEAMWMRTNPNIRRMLQMVKDGVIGTPLQVRAELGYAAEAEKIRMWDPELGASALLDMGIYPLTFAFLLLGEPDSIAAAGVLSDQGIDLNAGATLTYANGAVANIAWNQVAWSDNRGTIAGDAGFLEMTSRFHEPTGFSVTRGDQTETHEVDVIGRGYSHEIMEVADCLREGRTQSALLPQDESLVIMEQLDEILRQLGVTRR
jgi:predicted dehydrogenase